MSKGHGTILLVALSAALAGACGAAPAPDHPAELPPLAPDTQFPRCSSRDLALAGYPDHMHAWSWSDWSAPRDEDGVVLRRAARAGGMSYEDLVLRILQDAALDEGGRPR